MVLALYEKQRGGQVMSHRGILKHSGKMLGQLREPCIAVSPIEEGR